MTCQWIGEGSQGRLEGAWSKKGENSLGDGSWEECALHKLVIPLRSAGLNHERSKVEGDGQ